MNRRLQKINKEIQRLFGQIILTQAELPTDVLVTVSTVETAKHLRRANIWLYISPENRATEILDLLNQQIYELQGALNRALNIHPLPRIKLHLDHGATHAANVEQHFQSPANGA